MKDLYRNPIFYYITVPLLVGIWPLAMAFKYLPEKDSELADQKKYYEKSKSLMEEILTMDPDRLSYVDVNQGDTAFSYAVVIDKVASSLGIREVTLNEQFRTKEGQRAKVKLEDIDIQASGYSGQWVLGILVVYLYLDLSGAHLHLDQFLDQRPGGAIGTPNPQLIRPEEGGVQAVDVLESQVQVGVVGLLPKIRKPALLMQFLIELGHLVQVLLQLLLLVGEYIGKIWFVGRSLDDRGLEVGQGCQHAFEGGVAGIPGLGMLYQVISTVTLRRHPRRQRIAQQRHHHQQHDRDQEDNAPLRSRLCVSVACWASHRIHLTLRGTPDLWEPPCLPDRGGFAERLGAADFPDCPSRPLGPI